MKKSLYIAAISMITILSSGPSKAEGNIAAGKEKVQTCLGCHAQANYNNVYPSYRVPKLAGQHAEYIASALKAYQAGTRKHHTMHANSANLSSQDIADIAAFLSASE